MDCSAFSPVSLMLLRRPYATLIRVNVHAVYLPYAIAPPPPPHTHNQTPISHVCFCVEHKGPKVLCFSHSSLIMHYHYYLLLVDRVYPILVFDTTANAFVQLQCQLKGLFIVAFVECLIHLTPQQTTDKLHNPHMPQIRKYYFQIYRHKKLL